MCVLDPNPFAPSLESHVLNNANASEASNDNRLSSGAKHRAGPSLRRLFLIITQPKKDFSVKTFHVAASNSIVRSSQERYYCLLLVHSSLLGSSNEATFKV